MKTFCLLVFAAIVNLSAYANAQGGGQIGTPDVDFSAYQAHVEGAVGSNDEEGWYDSGEKTEGKLTFTVKNTTMEDIEFKVQKSIDGTRVSSTSWITLSPGVSTTFTSHDTHDPTTTSWTVSQEVIFKTHPSQFKTLRFFENL